MKGYTRGRGRGGGHGGGRGRGGSHGGGRNGRGGRASESGRVGPLLVLVVEVVVVRLLVSVEVVAVNVSHQT